MCREEGKEEINRWEEGCKIGQGESGKNLECQVEGLFYETVHGCGWKELA